MYDFIYLCIYITYILFVCLFAYLFIFTKINIWYRFKFPEDLFLLSFITEIELQSQLNWSDLSKLPLAFFKS